MVVNLNTVGEILTNSLNPSEVKTAEIRLKEASFSKEYALVLMDILDIDYIHNDVKVASAIAFKNYILCKWDQVDADCKSVIESNVISLMVRAERKVQRQLYDAIAHISLEQFWLVEDLIVFLNSGNFQSRLDALQALRSVLKKQISANLAEITEMIAVPLTETLILCMGQNSTDPTNRLFYEIIAVTLKVFRCLCLRSLVAYMGPTLDVWFDCFLEILANENQDDVITWLPAHSQILSISILFVENNISTQFGFYFDNIYNAVTRLSAKCDTQKLRAKAFEFISSANVSGEFKMPPIVFSETAMGPTMEFSDDTIGAEIDGAECLEIISENQAILSQMQPSVQIKLQMLKTAMEHSLPETVVETSEASETEMPPNIISETAMEPTMELSDDTAELSGDIMELADNTIGAEIESVRSLELLPENQRNAVKSLMQDFLETPIVDNSPYLTNSDFKTMEINPIIVDNILSMDIKSPSLVQAGVIPWLLQHHIPDIWFKDNYGTGKTLAYAVAVLNRVTIRLKHTQAICLVSSYEAALQLSSLMADLAVSTGISIGMAVKRTKPFLTYLDRHVIIGTPKEVLGLLYLGVFKLNDLNIIVFDDADIVATGDTWKKLKVTDCQKVYVSSTKIHIENVTQMDFSFPYVNTNHYWAKCLNLDEKINFIRAVSAEIRRSEPKIIIFCNKKETAAEVYKRLIKSGNKASQIHGLLSVTERQKELESFQFINKLLVTTNVSARAFNIPVARIVIHFDLCLNIQQSADVMHYKNRTGRVGRFGTPALSITLLDCYDSYQKYEEMTKIIGFESKKI